MAKTPIIFKKSKITISSDNQINSEGKYAVNFWYDLIKSIFIKVKIIRSSSEHAVFSWIYNLYKYFIAIETDYIPMATHNRVCFERLMQ